MVKSVLFCLIISVIAVNGFPQDSGRSVSALSQICARFPDTPACKSQSQGKPSVPPTGSPSFPADNSGNSVNNGNTGSGGGPPQQVIPPNIPSSSGGDNYCTNFQSDFNRFCQSKPTDPGLYKFCTNYGGECLGWNIRPQTAAPFTQQPTPQSPFGTPPPVFQPQPTASPFINPGTNQVGPVQPVQPVQPNTVPKQAPAWLMSGTPLGGIGGSNPNLQQFGGPVNGGLGLGRGFQVPFVGASEGGNIVPTQGLLGGRSLNVAGLGFQQTAGINYGGLPGLSKLNQDWGLGPNSLQGSNSLQPVPNIFNSGKRRRRRS